MGINNLTQIGTLTPVEATGDNIDQYYSALSVDLVPRNSSGQVTASAGDCGTATYPWKNGNISGYGSVSGSLTIKGTTSLQSTTLIGGPTTITNSVLLTGNVYANNNIVIGSGYKLSSGDETSPDCIPGGITLVGSQASTNPIFTIKNPNVSHLINDTGIAEADTVFSLTSQGGLGDDDQTCCIFHSMGYQASTRFVATVENAVSGCHLIDGRTYITSTGLITDVEANDSNLLLNIQNNGTRKALITANGKIYADGGISIGDDAELTISSGEVLITKLHHSIDTESDAASDDLDDILTTNFYVNTGDILVLKPENVSRVVTVKNGTGNIRLNGSDYVMNTSKDRLVLIRDGLYWYELLRTNNNKGSSSELTISSDEVTIFKLYHSIDTESDNASDDLATINYDSDNFKNGDVLILKPENAGRVVTVKDSVDNIKLNGGDYVMNDAKCRLSLILDGGDWYELSRS